MTLEEFTARLTVMLRNHLPSIAARLTDSAIAYWDGHRVRYAFLKHDGSGRLDKEFELDDRLFNEWHTELHTWVAHPHYGAFPELTEW